MDHVPIGRHAVKLGRMSKTANTSLRSNVYDVITPTAYIAELRNLAVCLYVWSPLEWWSLLRYTLWNVWGSALQKWSKRRFSQNSVPIISKLGPEKFIKFFQSMENIICYRPAKFKKKLLPNFLVKCKKVSNFNRLYLKQFSRYLRQIS